MRRMSGRPLARPPEIATGDTIDRVARLFAPRAEANAALTAEVERARRHAKAAARAAGGGSEAERSAAFRLAADLAGGFALDDGWGGDEILPLVGAIAEALAVDPRVVTLELHRSLVADPRLLELPPRVAAEAELRLLLAVAPVEDASVWTAEPGERPECFAHAGTRARTRPIQAMAAEILRGGAAARPAAGATLHAVAVVRWDRPLAALVVRARPAERERALVFARALAAHLGPLIERESLLERSAARERTLVAAAERRLARLGFDLHDGPIQDVLALGAEVRLFRDQLARVLGPHPDAGTVLGRVEDVMARLVALDHELREIVRALESPTVLRTPLPDLLRSEVEGLRDRGVDVALEVSGAFDALTPSQAIVLLRVVQEALANVEEHAGAETARVAIAADRTQLRAEVTDDGAGFDVERTLVEAARRGRLGLVGMGERVRLLGGRLDVDSRPGGPTTIAVALPRWQPPGSERRG